MPIAQREQVSINLDICGGGKKKYSWRRSMKRAYRFYPIRQRVYSMKKLVLIAFFIVGLLTLQHCEKGQTDQNKIDSTDEQSRSSTKMIDYLVGEWKIDSVQSGAASNDTAGRKNETLTFTQEARYIVRSGNDKVDSGAYRMNEQLKNLYLESEANEKPREYEIQVSKDTLILSSKEDKGETVYIYSRN